MMHHYINTDLDLVSKDDLSSIALYLNERACVLHAAQIEPGTWLVSVESIESGIVGDPESCPVRDIAALVTLLEQMPAEQKALLSRCTKFEFNIGWRSQEQATRGEFRVSSKLLTRIAATGAGLAVTVYPPSEDGW